MKTSAKFFGLAVGP